MASVGAEHEQAIAEWMKAFEALPAEQRDNIERWFATQKIIIENTGLTAQQWFGYIEWAMDNPLDYSFILDFPATAESMAAADDAERTDSTRDARRLVGADTPVTAGTGDGGLQDKATSDRKVERELFDRFMKERLGGGGRR